MIAPHEVQTLTEPHDEIIDWGEIKRGHNFLKCTSHIAQTLFLSLILLTIFLHYHLPAPSPSPFLTSMGSLYTMM